MAFLPILRSIRHSFKNPPPHSADKSTRKKKGRGGGRVGVSRFRAQIVREYDDESGSAPSGKLDVKVLFSVLERLELVLILIHLDRFPDSLKSLVQTVAEIPVMALELCGNSASYNKLCDLCSRILGEVLRAEHGDQLIAAAEVLKSGLLDDTGRKDIIAQIVSSSIAGLSDLKSGHFRSDNPFVVVTISEV